jgi:hypothetical protein
MMMGCFLMQSDYLRGVGIDDALARGVSTNSKPSQGLKHFRGDAYRVHFGSQPTPNPLRD